MESEIPGSDSPQALEGLLDDLTGAHTLEAVLEVGARSLAEISGVAAAAVVLFDAGRVSLERWHPPGSESRPDAQAWRERALEAVGLRPSIGRAGATPAPAGPILVPMSLNGRVSGAALLEPRPGPAPRREVVERVVRAIACRVGAELEMASHRDLHAKYQRWFKTLDEQLRVLDRERQKFSAIVHSSDAAVFVVDRQRAIRWTNSVMGERPPDSSPSWIGLGCHDACRRFAREDGEGQCDACPVARAFDLNAVVHREYRDTRDGEVRSLYLSALPIRDPHGKPEEVMVMLQDLTDLEVLRASETRYRLLFERSSRAIVMVDPATRRILLANPTASRMTGYPPERLHASSLHDLHPDTDWPGLDPLYAQALAEGSLDASECRLRASDGTVRVAVVTGTRADLDGRQVLMLEFRDVTETRRVEEALRNAEARLRRVVAASPIVLFAIDGDGTFTLSEGRGLESLGLEPGQVVGQSVFDVYRDHHDIIQCIRRALAGEELTAVTEVGTLTFDTSYAPLRGPDGQILGVIGVATDVTARRHLEDQLRQAQRMEAIGRLAGGVAHDFNNLLAAMLGHSELMLARLEAGHPLRRNAEEIQRAATRGAMLTRQLLAFGRKDVLAWRVVDLNGVVAGMEGMLQRLIGEDIQFECVTGTRPAAVRADAGQLEQVVLNLVVNARDAMPTGGRLTVEVSHATIDDAHAQRHPVLSPGPHVLLTVTDTGCGMDSETLAHVFEPFFTTKERGKGTGLGLATVYGIVEQSGGEVQATSEPGRGSTFRVFLPGASEDDIQPEAGGPPVPARGGTETILLVEDESAVRSTAREALEASGYEVIEARDGVEALEIAERGDVTIRLLVSDVVMPRMGGGQLAERLARARPGMRVLFISGYPDDALVRHGVSELGAALLQKPFALTDLVRRVRELLDQPARDAA